MSRRSRRINRNEKRAENPEKWEDTGSGWSRKEGIPYSWTRRASSQTIDDHVDNSQDVSEESRGLWQRVKENASYFGHATLNPIKQALGKGWSYDSKKLKYVFATCLLTLTLAACNGTATPIATPTQAGESPTPSAVYSPTPEASATAEPTAVAPEPIALDAIIDSCEGYENTISVDVELLEGGNVASIVEGGFASDCYGQDYNAKIHGLWSHIIHQGGGITDEQGNLTNHNLVKPGTYSMYSLEGVGGGGDGFRIIVPEPTPTTLPKIIASCYPNASAPLEDLVILRGTDHLFDPSCQVSGGVGQISASWDINKDGTPESNQVDPAPMSLQPGEYTPRVTFTDGAGQVLTVELPRIVKVGEPNYPQDYGKHGVNIGDPLVIGIIQSVSYINELQNADPNVIIRLGIHPSVISKGRGVNNFAEYDRIIKQINHPLPIILEPPKWMGGTELPVDPLDPDHFADMSRFAYEFLKHYPHIKIIEVGNEVDDPQFYNMTAEEYVFFLNSIAYGTYYDDPENIVAITAPRNIYENWLSQVIQAGGCNLSNATTLHYYTEPEKLQDVLNTISYFENLSGQCGKHINLITEAGTDLTWFLDQGIIDESRGKEWYATLYRILNSDTNLSLLALNLWNEKHVPFVKYALQSTIQN